jgi:uncharacterized protein YdhG (YjbR/CyaY superfamily)
MTTQHATVDDYIASHPQPVQHVLHTVRAAIRRALPDADEVISYAIPTFKSGGKPVVYFAGWKQHYSVYPVSADVAALLRDESVPHSISKGTIRFPLSEPVPVALIERIAAIRAKDVEGDNGGTSVRTTT